VAVVDCTGHGVPGAFMSMLGSSFLNDLVIAEGFKNPSVILKRMDKKINQFFNHRNNNKENKVLDGMDMSILVLHKDLKNNIFTKAVYAGAMNSLYYLQDGRGIEIKATKKPIGGSQFMVDSEFQNHEINLLNKKTYFYLFSDGYADQFGEKENKKFRTKHFREGLFSINQLDMYEQKEVLLSSLSTWQGREEQTDDITVVGILIDNTKNSEV
jgi:serine phosphatase RsbU (regulator of sigma subunit)